MIRLAVVRLSCRFFAFAALIPLLAPESAMARSVELDEARVSYQNRSLPSGAPVVHFNKMDGGGHMTAFPGDRGLTAV